MTTRESTSLSGETGENGWTTVVKAEAPLLDFKLGELWRYRDLVKMLVIREFSAQYKQTILGPLWFLIQPLVTTLVFTVVFGKIAKLPTDGVPPMLFYLTGVTIWGYFSNCMLKTSNTFAANASLFGKVYFPRLCVPISAVIANLANFGIQLVQLLAFFIYFKLSGADANLTVWIFALPLFLFMAAGLGFGAGIIISAVTTKYRDFQHLVGFGVQMLLYLTPVVYPLTAVPEKWQWLARLNPMTPVVEGVRLAFLGRGDCDWSGIAYCLLVMLLALAGGALLFNRVERSFMDTV